MNRTEYLAIIEDAKKQYIADNCSVAIGDTIRIGEQTGIVETIDISSTGTFWGTWIRYKKNGSLYSYSNNLSNFDFRNATKVYQKGGVYNG